MTISTRCGYSGPVSGPVTVPFDRTEFLVGFAVGSIGLLLGMALAWAFRSRRPVPVAGLLLGFAGALALWRAVVLCPGLALPPGLTAGMGALAAGGLAGSVVNAPSVTLAFLALPGAYLVATRGDVVDVGWVRLFVVVVVAVGGLLVADFDRRWRGSALGPVLVAVSAVGIFYTVPDTEEAMVLLGVSLPMALLGWPRPLASLGTAGSFVTVAFLCWTVVAAGLGRLSSIVGGVACLGLLWVEPVAVRLGNRVRKARPLPAPAGRLQLWAVPLVALVHLGLVYVASRVAGLRATVAEATTVALLEGVIAVVLLAWLVVPHVRRLMVDAPSPPAGEPQRCRHRSTARR